MEKKKYYLVYQITNKLNNMIYIGGHVTENINDKYMGSGTNIRKAIKQYGLENFDKSILYCFDNLEDMFAKEKELVNREFIAKDNNYNICIGGSGLIFTDCVTVKDKNGNTFSVNIKDPKYLSGELTSITTGKIAVKDKNGNNLQVDKDDPRYLAGELISVNKNKIIVIDKDGNLFQVDKDDPRYLSGELIHKSKNKILVKDKYNNYCLIDKDDPNYLSGILVGATKGKITVKDKDGNTFSIDKDDPRYLSGELVGIFKNRKHSEETKKKMSESSKGKGIGNLNSAYNKCWINKDYKNKMIKKNELEYYVSISWTKGRKYNVEARHLK